MTWLDWLIIAPILPVIGTWWLPWERWFFDGTVRRRYSVLIAWDGVFATCWFHQSWWVIAGYALFAVLVTGAGALAELRDHGRQPGERSSLWTE